MAGRAEWQGGGWQILLLLAVLNSPGDGLAGIFWNSTACTSLSDVGGANRSIGGGTCSLDWVGAEAAVQGGTGSGLRSLKSMGAGPGVQSATSSTSLDCDRT